VLVDNPIMMLAAVVGALVVIFGGLRSIYKVTRRLDDAIGVDDKGRTISARLDRVEHQLWENGGDSLADRVNKLGACANETAAEVKLIKELLIGMVSAQAANEQAKPERVRKQKTA
jgi:hypothetical protein